MATPKKIEVQVDEAIIATAEIGTQVISIRAKNPDETQAEYNEAVPPAYQPLAEPITTNYLGEPL